MNAQEVRKIIRRHVQDVPWAALQRDVWRNVQDNAELHARYDVRYYVEEHVWRATMRGTVRDVRLQIYACIK